MTAQHIDFQTAVFPGLDAGSEDNVTLVNTQLSFALAEYNVRTLSTNGISLGESIVGPLYVPSLSSDACINATAEYIPSNVTRYADLPPNKNYHQVAFGPWVPQCVGELLANAMTDPLLRAFIFWVPDSGTDTPPASNDPVWSLNDGGHWKTDHEFAIYAIPGAIGPIIMDELALYSGNLTSVPYGHELSEQYHPSDYVREIVQIPTSSSNQLPSLWVFLLIVLGILVLTIVVSSVAMHWLQRRRRRSLRDRVVRGEVDLEALGIRRLTVPQEVLDKMPVYIYSDDPVANPPTTTSTAATAKSSAEHTTTVPLPTHTRDVSTNSPHYAQPTCAICLDDFEPNETLIRQLPCHHIFHPNCIDSFLRDNSSLCPLCKKTVLPQGYCPAVITNAMVRRERWVRRVRERARRRGIVDSEDSVVDDEAMRQEMEASRSRSGFLMTGLAELLMGRSGGGGGGGGSTTGSSRGAWTRESRRGSLGAARARTMVPSAQEVDLEMQQQQHSLSRPSSPPQSFQQPTIAHTGQASTPDTPARPPRALHARREWCRNRALHLLGRTGNPPGYPPMNRDGAGGEISTVTAPELRDEDDIPRARWRKVVGIVWPR